MTFTIHCGSQRCQDPIALLEEQASERVPKLVPIGYGRMSASPFAVFRAVKGNGEAHIRADPPLIVPIRDLVDRAGARRLELAGRMLLDSYPASLSGDRRRLLERYGYADLARKVVGVGSVRTRCWVILLLGRDPSAALSFRQTRRRAPRRHSDRARTSGGVRANDCCQLSRVRGGRTDAT